MPKEKIILERRSKYENVAVERDLKGRVIKTERREYVKSANNIDFFGDFRVFLKEKGPEQAP